MPRQRIAHALFIACLWLTPGVLASPAFPVQETPTVRTPPPQQIEPPAKAAAPAALNETEQYTLSRDRYEKAVAYSRAGYTLYFLSFFIGFAVLILALRFGLVARIRDFAQHTTENRFLQGLLFIPMLGFLIDLADLPVGIAWHALSLHYEQSVQQWGSWLFDRCKAELIDLAFLTLLGLILFLVIRKSPQRWWFYFWLAALPIILGVFILEPVIIDPLFYKLEPLAHHLHRHQAWRATARGPVCARGADRADRYRRDRGGAAEQSVARGDARLARRPGAGACAR